MASFKELITFYKLARQRSKSLENYLVFQKYQAELLVKDFQRRGINLKKLKVLELGCGKGGYSSVFKQAAGELVVADLKISEDLITAQPDLQYLEFDFNQPFPLADNSFDLVLCFSVIEHLPDPLKMLKEIKRILKADGILILTWPPFYSLAGGHSVKPFHYLGEKLAIKITNYLRGRDIKSYSTMYGSYGLYPLTIRRGKQLIKKSGLKIIDQAIRFFPLNLAKIPLINEFLTWHLNLYCRK